MADPWNIAASAGSAAAAIFAGVQIWLSMRDANRRATLEALLLIVDSFACVYAARSVRRSRHTRILPLRHLLNVLEAGPPRSTPVVGAHDGS
jgi:hypothetical protein